MNIASLARVFCTFIALSSAPLAAEGLSVTEAYLRSSTPQSTSGAAFMKVTNQSGIDDRLIGASAYIAEKVEFHSHSSYANGVMRMGRIDGGIALGSGEMHIFERGGDHLMFMGLKQPLVQGDTVTVLLEFEKAGTVSIDIPVDQERKP